MVIKVITISAAVIAIEININWDALIVINSERVRMCVIIKQAKSVFQALNCILFIYSHLLNYLLMDFKLIKLWLNLSY